jgi:hypothetical protein
MAANCSFTIVATRAASRMLTMVPYHEMRPHGRNHSFATRARQTPTIQTFEPKADLRVGAVVTGLFNRRLGAGVRALAALTRPLSPRKRCFVGQRRGACCVATWTRRGTTTIEAVDSL